MLEPLEVDYGVDVAFEEQMPRAFPPRARTVPACSQLLLPFGFLSRSIKAYIYSRKKCYHRRTHCRAVQSRQPLIGRAGVVSAINMEFCRISRQS
eukprot:364943-Chlamydomonas_euryale.AAC.9